MQQTAVVSGILPTGLNDTVDITSAGLGDITAAIILTGGTTTIGSSADNVNLCVGLYAQNEYNCASVYSSDNVGTTQTARFLGTGVIGAVLDATGVVSSFSCSGITNGLRITSRHETTTPYTYVAHLIAGIEVSGGHFTMPNLIGSTSNIEAVDSGKLVLFCTTGQTTYNTYGGDASFSIGIAERGGPNFSNTMGMVDNVGTTEIVQRFETNRAVGAFDGNNFRWSAEVTDWPSGQFEVTNQGSTTLGAKVLFLAFNDGVSFNAGKVTTPGVSASQFFNTSGYPESVLLSVTSTDSSGTTTGGLNNHESLSIGLANTNRQLVYSITDGDNIDTANNRTLLSSGKIIDIDIESAGFF
jgi:hypothetical protein